MTPKPRTLRDDAIEMINQTGQRLNTITEGRSVPGDVAVGVLNAQSNLAIACSLLAIADAIRAAHAGPIQ
ncbi:hypothetical protein [Streptomyces sp. NPDC059949]|uniref:hypothetical protein n=1 Tax=Streptomyces sp. NPDC059949 TaxID=3347013 RepID=UPI0036638DD1